MRVAAYTGGLTIPSARARVRQYIAPLAARGIRVHEYPLPWGNILPGAPARRALWMGATASSRLIALTHSWKADVTWVSRQLLPAFVPLQALARKPMILDVDDAVWMNTGGHRVRELAAASTTIVAGNAYLAGYFRQFHNDVVVIPTPVDTNRFQLPPAASSTDIVLVWIGTSGNYVFLRQIEDAIARVFEQRPSVRMRVVADRPPDLPKLGARIEFVPWHSDTEVENLWHTSIGLMPLAEDAWCAGKCSYKMLCYMACGLPVIVSPVGMNREVLSYGGVGFGARSPEEWTDCLLRLVDDEPLRRRMGLRARKVVEESFSLQHLAPRYASVFHRVAGLS
jgi:glycosyltransferase involved in cell wall biosynthesis